MIHLESLLGSGALFGMSLMCSRTLLCIVFAVQVCAASAGKLQGYYVTFMRMPVMDLADWKDSMDCIADDGANTVVLWMGGGFRSKRFPITWAYNREHKNVEHDFARELIDYAHRKDIRILLGVTPFGYDGVNQYPLDHPELKARKADGSPVDAFGIHSWGWSLCPAKPASQQFMLDYVREMFFEFYANADGLMLESSDYNVCRCADCVRNYYEHEFKFVETISREVWKEKADASILVYPHYFSGKRVNSGTAIEAEAARKPFDKRWQLVFTPHSAAIDSELLKQGTAGVYSDQGLSLGTPGTLREAVQVSKQYALGYLPSLEPFSYVLDREEFGASHLVGKRLHPLGFDWMKEPRRPLRELPARVVRFAFSQFCRNANLTDQEFRNRVGRHFFGEHAAAEAIADLLFLQECINLNRDWVTSSPLVNPEWYYLKSSREKWPEAKLKDYEKRRARLRQISARYIESDKETDKEMGRIAAFINARWKADAGNHNSPR